MAAWANGGALAVSGLVVIVHSVFGIKLDDAARNMMAASASPLNACVVVKVALPHPTVVGALVPLNVQEGTVRTIFPSIGKFCVHLNLKEMLLCDPEIALENASSEEAREPRVFASKRLKGTYLSP